jgi:hypothetical protein
MSLYFVTHTHEYGASTFLVSSETYPTEKQVVRELELEYEPSKSEGLLIVPSPTTNTGIQKLFTASMAMTRNSTSSPRHAQEPLAYLRAE